jgi:hypothetical protein
MRFMKSVIFATVLFSNMSSAGYAAELGDLQYQCAKPRGVAIDCGPSPSPYPYPSPSPSPSPCYQCNRTDTAEHESTAAPSTDTSLN